MDNLGFLIYKAGFNLISFFTLIYITNIFLTKKNYSKYPFIIWISSYSVFHFAGLFIDSKFYYNSLSINFFIIYIIVFYQNSILEKIFGFLTITFIIYYGEIISSNIIELVYHTTVMDYRFEILLLVIRFLLILLYIYTIKNSKMNINLKVDNFSKKQLLILILLLLLSFGYVVLFDLRYDDLSINNIFKLFSLVVITLLVLGSIVIVQRFNKEVIISHINKLSKEQLEIQLSHYNNLELALEETRKIKHDMKNHLICLKYLSDNKNYKELDKYLGEIQDSINVINTGIYTGNNVIDAIINQKITRAKEDNIVFNISGSLPQNPFIDAIDICAIVSNTIDNAIEACLRMEHSTKCTIDIQTYIERDHWIYKITNTSDPVKISTKDGLIATSKNDQINHGLGLKNIHDSVNKYNGVIKMNYENNHFALNTTIPLI